MIIFFFGEVTSAVKFASTVTLLTGLSDTDGRLPNLCQQMKVRSNKTAREQRVVCDLNRMPLVRSAFPVVQKVSFNARPRVAFVALS